jgi:hypothetical protein
MGMRATGAVGPVRPSIAVNRTDCSYSRAEVVVEEITIRLNWIIGFDFDTSCIDAWQIQGDRANAIYSDDKFHFSTPFSFNVQIKIGYTCAIKMANIFTNFFDLIFELVFERLFKRLTSICFRLDPLGAWGTVLA